MGFLSPHWYVMGGYHIQADNIAGLEMSRKIARHLFPKVRGYVEGTALK